MKAAFGMVFICKGPVSVFFKTTILDLAKSFTTVLASLSSFLSRGSKKKKKFEFLPGPGLSLYYVTLFE